MSLHCPNSARDAVFALRAERCPFVSGIEFEAMCLHYFIAYDWADGEECGKGRPTAQAWLAVAEQCAEFCRFIGADDMQRIRDALADGYGTHPDCGPRAGYMAALGHDFYLTRAGHGVGFADRKELPDDLAIRLFKVCGWRCQFGEPEFTAANGWLYVER